MTGTPETAAAIRVLLTGASGFIGSHVARLLVAEGHHVTAILRPGTSRVRIADILSRLDIVEADLRNLSTINDALRARQPDVCIHLAWQGWAGAEVDANMTSLGFSVELLRAMVELSCRRFVGAGTCFEYDLTPDTCDRAPNGLTEHTPLNPHDLYGACKKALFEVGEQFSALTGVSVVTPRMFYSYGPYENPPRLMPSIARALIRNQIAALTPGEQVKDYLHVEDVASAIWMIAKSDLVGAVNVASGKPVTVAQIASTIGKILGKRELVQLGALQYREGEPMNIVGDPSRLRESLRWSPKFGLDVGLAQTVSWWQEEMRNRPA